MLWRNFVFNLTIYIRVVVTGRLKSYSVASYKYIRNYKYMFYVLNAYLFVIEISIEVLDNVS